MANETTTTTMTGAINTSVIAKVMNNYAIDANVMLPNMRMEPVSGTKTAAFNIPTKSTGVAAITEATAMSNAALTFANTTVAVSEVGILRLVMKLAARTNVLGDAGTYNWVATDGVRLCLEKMETDCWAQLANASTSVGTTTQTYTIANYAGLLSQLFINKARGRAVVYHTATQQKNFRAALAAAASTTFSDGSAASVLNRTGDNGYGGSLWGAEIFVSNLNATANSAADGVGGAAIDGQTNPENAATGMALGWMPELEQVASPTFPGRTVAVTTAYGLGEIADFNYVKAVTVV